MKVFKIAISLFLTFGLASCAPDRNNSVYTADSTLGLMVKGKVINVRLVTIKNKDRLDNNGTGMLAGGVMGGAIGNSAGSGVATVAGAIAGAAIGAAAESSLGTSKGYEYIVQIDPAQIKHDYYEGSSAMRAAISAASTSGLIAVVQGTDNPLHTGQNVYVIFSNDRTRVISAPDSSPHSHDITPEPSPVKAKKSLPARANHRENMIGG